MAPPGKGEGFMKHIWMRSIGAGLGILLLLTGCTGGQTALSSVSGTETSTVGDPTSSEQDTADSSASSGENVPGTTLPGTPGSSSSDGKTVPRTDPTETDPATSSSGVNTTATTENPSAERPDLRHTFVLSTFMALDGDTNAAKNQRILRNTRDAGLNAVEVTWLSTEESILAALQAAEKVPGIALLVQNARGADQKGTNLGGIAASYMPSAVSAEEIGRWSRTLRGYDALAGYYVWDEPYLPQLELCGRLTELYRSADPDHMAFSCILPSYGEYRWPSTYPAYVDSYLRTVRPEVLSLDYYPFLFQTDIATTSDLYRDMGYMRKKSLEYGIPYWHYFQAIQNGQPLTVPQIQVQMAVGLTYGVKGLSYYTSQYSLTDVNGHPTAAYAALKAVNTRVKNIGNLLYGKTNAALYHTGLAASYNDAYFLDTLASSPWLSSAPANLSIGVFTDGSAIYLAVANKSHTASVSGTLELKREYALAEYLPDGDTVRSLSRGRSISLNLEAAGIQVFILK